MLTALNLQSTECQTNSLCIASWASLLDNSVYDVFIDYAPENYPCRKIVAIF